MGLLVFLVHKQFHIEARIKDLFEVIGLIVVAEFIVILDSFKDKLPQVIRQNLRKIDEPLCQFLVALSLVSFCLVF